MLNMDGDSLLNAVFSYELTWELTLVAVIIGLKPLFMVLHLFNSFSPKNMFREKHKPPD